MRIVFYLLMFGAIVAFGFVLAADAPQQKLSRFGPGGSKFISPHEPAREVWRMPTWTEAIVYIQYYAGGFDDIPDARQKGPAAIHQEMVDAVQQSLELADQMGVPTGPTLFDPHLEQQNATSSRLPQIRPMVTFEDH